MTTTETLTLSDFLLARIAEDEADQRAGLDKRYGAAEQWHRADCGLNTLNVEPCDCDIPARVLAECEAKLRIVEIHRLAQGAYDADGIEHPGKECRTCWDDWPCDTLRALASVYADHADYREEWAL